MKACNKKVRSINQYWTAAYSRTIPHHQIVTDVAGCCRYCLTWRARDRRVSHHYSSQEKSEEERKIYQ